MGPEPRLLHGRSPALEPACLAIEGPEGDGEHGPLGDGLRP
jgi:hypothetical protein